MNALVLSDSQAPGTVGAMAPDLHVVAASRLRPLGQRYTPNRRALVDVLAAAARPLAVHDILAVRADVPQSSAYRNLMVLAQAGVVRRVSGSDEFARFELAEDLMGHHHHLVCSNCGALQDFDASPQMERAMARTVEQVAAATGFAVRDHHLGLTGLCRNCS
jgi:Fur family ferric uptake transcriptional regulator